MSALSNIIKNGQTLQVQAGPQAVAVNDLLQIGGPGLKAYPVKVLDYAVRCAAATISAAASVQPYKTTGYDRQAVVTDALGNIYIAMNFSSSGIVVFKYSPTGVIINSAATSLISGTGTPMNQKLLLLSNGNLCVMGSDANNVIKFCIVDANLNIVAGPTTVATGYLSGAVGYFDACAMSGGGFAVSYLNSAATQMLLATYSNAGAVVQAAINIQTFAAGPALVYPKIGQLSSGNLVVAMRSATATPSGTTFVIVTTAGVSVKANTAHDSVVTAGLVELSIMPGYFGIADMNATNIVAGVYDNTGMLQGGKFTSANTINSATQAQCNLVNDGVGNFYLGYTATGANYITVIPINGTGFVTSPNMPTSTNVNGTAASVALVLIGGNMAVLILMSSSTAQSQYYLVGLPDASLGVSVPYQISANPVSIGSGAATTGCFWPRAISQGDMTFTLVYENQNSANTFLAIIKAAASAILGISQTANAANNEGTPASPTLLTVNPGPGAYAANPMQGTNGTQFDHTFASPPGTKGRAYTNGASLGGIFVTSNIN